MNTDKKDPAEIGSRVITPGGPRLKKDVHLIPPGSTVVFDEGKPAASPDAHARQPLQARATNATTNLVLTPGGYHERSRVHLVEPGQAIKFHAGGPVIEARPRTENAVRVRPEPPSGANWISAGWWQNTTGMAISAFRTTWNVPPAPTTQASQLIYLFNGLEPSDSSTILQPVLQWGGNDADEDGVTRVGLFWTVASWIVPDATGNVHHTPHVRVNPGDTLIGVMTRTSMSDGKFTYTCEFQGISGSNFTVTDLPELVWAVETLEVYELASTATPPYDLNAPTEYPATDYTAFQDINIQTGNVNPSVVWEPTNIVTSYGEQTDVVSDSATSGEVDIYYRRPPLQLDVTALIQSDFRNGDHGNFEGWYERAASSSTTSTTTQT